MLHSEKQWKWSQKKDEMLYRHSEIIMQPSNVVKKSRSVKTEISVLNSDSDVDLTFKGQGKV
nr:unnamed protein product [Callosobruchus chinensis]